MILNSMNLGNGYFTVEIDTDYDGDHLKGIYLENQGMEQRIETIWNDYLVGTETDTENRRREWPADHQLNV